MYVIFCDWTLNYCFFLINRSCTDLNRRPWWFQAGVQESLKYQLVFIYHVSQFCEALWLQSVTNEASTLFCLKPSALISWNLKGESCTYICSINTIERIKGESADTEMLQTLWMRSHSVLKCCALQCCASMGPYGHRELSGCKELWDIYWSKAHVIPVWNIIN